MRKRMLTLILITLFTLCSCGLKTDTIYLVDDNFNDSSSFSDYIKILNINKITDGWVKGFMPNKNDILVARSKDAFYTLSTVSIDNLAVESEIYKSTSPIIPYIEVSSISKKVLAGDMLIDINTNTTTKLKTSKSRSETISDYSSYSFLTGDIPVNIDFEYLYDIINNLGTGLLAEGKQYFDIINTWFFISKDNNWYINFKPISMHNLNLSVQKYFFISSYGSSSYTIGSNLWCYDFRTRTLNKIDDNVKTFEVSPDQNLIGYVVIKDGNESLMTYNFNDTISKTNKKLMATFPDISGLQFSPSGKWLSFSAGEKQKNDIYLTSSYDSKLIEQLTHGYNSTGTMYWSKDSRRIAFNSFKKEGLPQNPDIYSISITIKKEKSLTTSYSPQTTPYLDDINNPFVSDKFYNSLLYITEINNYQNPYGVR